MSELIDIIVSAVDEASETFESISGAANDMGEQISSATENNVQEWNDVVSAADDAADSISGAGDAAGNVDSAPVQDTASAATDLGNEADNAGGSLDNISNIIAGLAGVEVFSSMADSIMQLADSAGSFEDSMMRAGLEAEGAGISVGDMKTAVSDLSDETGRAGGQIRESFINATARGITDLDSFKTMMEGAGAQATLFNTDIQTMGNKFSTLAMRSTLMERQLGSTGITMTELASAMGMSGATADEVKEKWKELDANQRAAVLGQAASMNEGEQANEAYKNSWAGLHEQIDIARGRLERLVGEIFLPVLIPVMKAAGDVMQWLGDVIQGAMTGPFGMLISIIGTVGAAVALAIPAYIAISGAIGFMTATAIPAAAALWAMVAPLLPFIAIGVAIVAIIYEIGKAFGWWTDASSMLDAIGAGLQRMWDAFINHPDVQATISAVSSALSTLWSWIQQAGQAIMEFFGISTSGEFDIVRSLIDGIGLAWQITTVPIRAVIGLIQAAAGVFGGLWSGTLVPFGEWLSGVFGPVWTFIGDTINAIMPFVQGLTSAFSSFQAGQMSLPGLIMSIMSTLWNIYLTILSRISNAVINWASSIVSNAISGATRFVMGIVTRIMALPGRFLAYLNQTRARIVQQMTIWVTTARTKITQFIQGIITKIMTLPAKVGALLRAVVGTIRSAIQQWVSAAKEKAQKVVDGVRSALSGTASAVSGALSGVVDAIVGPFKKAYEDAKGWWDKVASLGQARGGETFEDFMGVTNTTSAEETILAGGNDSIDINHNITLDLANVPSQIDTNTLITMLSDTNVLRALTGNPDFQSLDARVKERLNLKQVRARGR